jgi:hypothetical protein
MTVKIDGVEPNIFPDVEDLDARDAGRNVEVFLDIRVEGKQTPVTVKLSYEQASDLASHRTPIKAGLTLILEGKNLIKARVKRARAIRFGKVPPRGPIGSS